MTIAYVIGSETQPSALIYALKEAATHIHKIEYKNHMWAFDQCIRVHLFIYLNIFHIFHASQLNVLEYILIAFKVRLIRMFEELRDKGTLKESVQLPRIFCQYREIIAIIHFPKMYVNILIAIINLSDALNIYIVK